MMNEIIDVPMKGQRDLATVTAEIRSYCTAAQTMMVTYAIEIGRRLVEAKSMVKHGEWGDYLREELGLSQSTANNHMKLFEGYAAGQISLTGAALKNQAFANLTYTKALALLALPSEEEREAFVAEHDLSSMSTRELKEELRRRTEGPSDDKTGDAGRIAERAANDRPYDPDDEPDGDPTGEIGMLEWQLEKAQQEAKTVGERYDAAMEEIRAQNIRESNLVDQLRTAKAKQTAAEGQAQEAERKLTQAKKDLKAARDAEAEALKKLRAAEKDKTVHKETLDKLRKEAEKAAEKSFKSDYEKLDAAQKEAAKAKAEAEKARQEAERLEKELRAAAPEIAEFKFLFGQAQETLSRCVEALPGLPPDKVPGCTKAIKRLMEGTLERLEADKWEAAMPE